MCETRICRVLSQVQYGPVPYINKTLSYSDKVRLSSVTSLTQIALEYKIK